MNNINYQIIINIHRIDPATAAHGSSICVAGGSNIYFNGDQKWDNGVPYALSNCNIKIDEIQHSHNGTWRCIAKIKSKGSYSDTINITTIHDHDVVIHRATILGITIPLAIILIICIILLLIWCCCPVYLAMCCYCIPACREKSEATSQGTNYTQTDRPSHSYGTQANLPSIPLNSRR